MRTLILVLLTLMSTLVLTAQVVDTSASLLRFTIDGSQVQLEKGDILAVNQYRLNSQNRLIGLSLFAAGISAIQFIRVAGMDQDWIALRREGERLDRSGVSLELARYKLGQLRRDIDHNVTIGAVAAAVAVVVGQVASLEGARIRATRDAVRLEFPVQ